MLLFFVPVEADFFLALSSADLSSVVVVVVVAAGAVVVVAAGAVVVVAGAAAPAAGAAAAPAGVPCANAVLAVMPIARVAAMQ